MINLNSVYFQITTEPPPFLTLLSGTKQQEDRTEVKERKIKEYENKENGIVQTGSKIKEGKSRGIIPSGQKVKDQKIDEKSKEAEGKKRERNDKEEPGNTRTDQKFQDKKSNGFFRYQKLAQFFYFLSVIFFFIIIIMIILNVYIITQNLSNGNNKNEVLLTNYIYLTT
jgi:hypothetical protein